jgi:hypothetical protein
MVNVSLVIIVMEKELMSVLLFQWGVFLGVLLQASHQESESHQGEEWSLVVR